MDLDALSAFALVAANGSVTRASRVSGRPKASLSRQVMALEASLGVRLFERGPRSIHLTAEGEQFYARTAGPLGEIEEAAESLRDGRSQPRGRLRISVPVVFGQLLMGRLAGDFTQACPEVKLEVAVEDREVDPVVEGFDIVVRVDPNPDEALVGRCFARDRMLIVAAPSLTPPWDTEDPQGRTPVPAVVRDPMANSPVWSIAGEPRREIVTRKVLHLPSLLMVRDAVATGVGAAKLPGVLVAGDLASGALGMLGRRSRPARRALGAARVETLRQRQGEGLHALARDGVPGRQTLIGPRGPRWIINNTRTASPPGREEAEMPSGSRHGGIA